MKWTPQTGIEAVQGSPYPDQPDVADFIQQMPAIPPTPQGHYNKNAAIRWVCTAIAAGNTDYVIAGRENRVLLIVQNNDTTNPLAINFDQTATIQGAGPYSVQGILILAGGVMYTDRWCPTNSVHIYNPSAQCTITEGLSSLGNVDDLIRQSGMF